MPEKLNLLTEEDLLLLARYEAEKQSSEYEGLSDDKERIALIAKTLKATATKLRGVILFSSVVENGIEKGSIVDKRSDSSLLTSSSYQELIKSMTQAPTPKDPSLNDVFTELQQSESELTQTYLEILEKAKANNMTVTNDITVSWAKFSSKWNRRLNEIKQQNLAGNLSDEHTVLYRYSIAIKDAWGLFDSQISTGKPMSKKEFAKLEKRITEYKKAAQLKLKAATKRK